MTRQHYAAIFISPHLDDAVFSCGGKMAMLSKDKKVLVINVFTSFDENIQKGAVVLGSERLIEEENASKVLNYEYVNLDEKDAFFRGWRKGSIGKVFYPPRDEDIIYLNHLKAKIFLHLKDITFDEVYIPLAVGWHIDHYLVHLAFSDVGDDLKKKIRFYEDVPYVFFKGARNERLSFIQMQYTSLFQNTLNISKTFFNSGFTKNIKKFPFRYLIMPFMFYYFLKLVFLHRKAKSNGHYSHLICEVFNCEQFFELKRVAVNCYSSQVKEFFVDENDLKSSYSHYSEKVLKTKFMSESYWCFQKSKF